MQQTYKNIFPDLPDSSRIWIYQSQIPISPEAQAEIQIKLNEFVHQWAAHKVQLYGAATILEDYFIVLAVDESMTMASGCSIDTSVHFIKTIEKEYNLNLFDRLNVLIEHNGKKKIVHFSDVINYSDAMFFNPMVKDLGEFRREWKKF
jgi:hypothetical protein